MSTDARFAYASKKPISFLYANELTHKVKVECSRDNYRIWK